LNNKEICIFIPAMFISGNTMSFIIAVWEDAEKMQWRHFQSHSIYATALSDWELIVTWRYQAILIVYNSVILLDNNLLLFLGFIAPYCQFIWLFLTNYHSLSTRYIICSKNEGEDNWNFYLYLKIFPYKHESVVLHFIYFSLTTVTVRKLLL
jgi:hypothetical protein